MTAEEVLKPGTADILVPRNTLLNENGVTCWKSTLSTA